LGGPADRVVTAPDDDAVVKAVRSADADGTPVLLVGGGSNLVVADDGWRGTAVLVRSRGVTVTVTGADRAALDVAAGEPWDELVARCVDDGLSGIECLAGIPGLSGATPVQNVSAYGQEVASVIETVRVWDRSASEVRDLAAPECGFGYRTSIFKHTDRYVVLRVRFSLVRDRSAAPVAYAELARALGVDVGDRVSVAEARDAVLSLRRAKGMVLDASDHDTWSAGSFFTNPILGAADVAAFENRLDADSSYPHWPESGGRKLSAAWLIERAGFHRGYALGAAAVSGKHTLAVTNRGGASTAEIIGLARVVRDGVIDRFGVQLYPEPRLVGVTL